jgi:hypothetical protein
MIKVSHELPLCFLNKGKEWNDYDFCLPTYWFKSEQYKQHYLDAKAAGRFIIADNGLFEGDSFTEKQLIGFVNELQPDIFVIPDVWNDALLSLRNAKRWANMKEILPENTKLMAVIQCTDYKIGSLLYGQYIDLGVEAIAFNHSSTAYQDFFPHENISISKMMGRIYFINQLKKTKIIDNHIHHHLLGCAVPDEFKYYGKGYEFIKTLDTSNPVVWGCKGVSYDENITSIEKPKEKIEEFFNENLDAKEKLIIFNINKFKNYINE